MMTATKNPARNEQRTAEPTPRTRRHTKEELAELWADDDRVKSERIEREKAAERRKATRNGVKVPPKPTAKPKTKTKVKTKPVQTVPVPAGFVAGKPGAIITGKSLTKPRIRKVMIYSADVERMVREIPSFMADVAAQLEAAVVSGHAGNVSRITKRITRSYFHLRAAAQNPPKRRSAMGGA